MRKAILIAALFLFVAARGYAQEAITSASIAAAAEGAATQPEKKLGGNVVRVLKQASKDVLLDPTTYVPAISAYVAKSLDWSSSQDVFRVGSREMNSKFTVEGTNPGTPISYSAGMRKIRNESLHVFAESSLRNFGASVARRILEKRYPNHKKLIKFLWIAERFELAGALLKNTSLPHYKQWQYNKWMVREFNSRVYPTPQWNGEEPVAGKGP